MDIFKRIETQDKLSQKAQTSQQNNEFYLGIGGYKVSEVDFFNVNQFEMEKYTYIGGTQASATQAKKAPENTEKLYEILSTPHRDSYSYSKYQKLVEKREKKVEKLLKKGVDPTLLSSSLLGRVVADMSHNERVMLTKYGFDIWGAIEFSYKWKELMDRNIYFCVKDMNNANILENINPVTLIYVINARRQLDITPDNVDKLVKAATSSDEEKCIKNLETLFKYGQIALEKDQVKLVYDYLIQNPRMQKEAPLLTKLCEQTHCLEPATNEQIYAKYSTQKTIKVSPKSFKKIDEIQSQIDKLFEDAQKSID